MDTSGVRAIHPPPERGGFPRILLKRALVIPANERWLHEPAMKKQLARADKWMNANPAKETNLDKLEAKLAEI
jgi:hypothetical protein